MKEKKHTSIDNQLEKLKERNITIDEHEEEETKKILERNNYYNVINAYKDPFLEEKYKDGTTIKEIYNLYKFDKNISKLFFGYLLTIEGVAKTVISDIFSEKYGHKHYLNKENFDYSINLNQLSDSKKISILKKNNEIKDLIKKLTRYIENETFAAPYIIHYKTKHEYVPLWVLVNVLTFGDIAKFYKYMKQSERDKAAHRLSLNKRINSKEMDNFFSVIGDFRNKSAHGQRFYTIQTKNERGIRYKLVFNDISYNEKEISHVDTSVFALILTIKVLLEKEEFESFFKSFILELKVLQENINTIDIEHILEKMGFISNTLELDTISKIEDFFNTIF